MDEYVDTRHLNFVGFGFVYVSVGLGRVVIGGGREKNREKKII